MKLPQIQYRPVGAPRNNLGPSVAVLEHQQKQRISQAVMDFGTTMANMATAAQKADAGQGFTDDLTGFYRDHLSKSQYTAAEVQELNLDDRVDLTGKDDDATVPAHEVHPHLLERTLRDSIRERSYTIKGNQARREWMDASEQQASKLIQQMVQHAGRERVRYDLDLGRKRIAASQAAGLFEQASEQIQAMPLDDEMKGILLEENAQHLELERINRLSNGGNWQAMQRELKSVMSGGSTLNPANAEKAERILYQGAKRARHEDMERESAPFYAAMRGQDLQEIGDQIEYLQSDSYDGKLDDKERYTWINTLESARDDILRGQSARSKVAEAAAKRNFTQMNRAIEEGLFPDPNVMAEQADEAALLVQSENATAGLRTAAADFLDNLRFMRDIQTAQRQSPAEQQERIQELRSMKVPAEQEGDRLTLIRKLEQVRDQTADAVQTDSMAYAQRTGQVQDILPAPEEPDFLEALQDRNQVDLTLQATYGTSTGPMTGIEANAMKAWLLDANARQITGLSAAVEQAMGDRAPVFWEQLMKTGAGPMAVAGTLEFTTAQQVLVGNDIRKESDQYTPAQLRTLRNAAMDEMGEAFGFDIIQRQARADAAVNYMLAAEFQGSEVSMVDAVNAVAGGLVDFNGQVINAPEPGVTSTDIRSWVSTLAPEDLPFIRQGSREDILEQLQGGGINLVPAGPGRFELQRVDTGTLLTTGDGLTPASLAWPGLEGVQARGMPGTGSMNSITGMPVGMTQTGASR